MGKIVSRRTITNKEFEECSWDAQKGELLLVEQRLNPEIIKIGVFDSVETGRRGGKGNGAHGLHDLLVFEKEPYVLRLVEFGKVLVPGMTRGPRWVKTVDLNRVRDIIVGPGAIADRLRCFSDIYEPYASVIEDMKKPYL
jgi:hypothetical protein